ncbi:MYND-type domain-containing protein [Mycena venus]|uniref:MYND-type domain-containing protein n=1 Tax=Mycena venus TaxID=2733690 RepID=A0A8H6YY36_9AGAR|nr:MYND-type domain-containing protein [Mycena venus]
MSLLLYGIFFVLFILAIQTLSSRNMQGKSTLIAATWAMFVVGTTRLVLYLVETAMSVYAVQESIQNPAGIDPVRRLLFALGLAQSVLFTLNVLVADLLFLWRCYVIWGNQKSVVILPGLFVAAMTVVSVIYCVTLRESVVSFDPTSVVDPRIPFIIGVLTNLGLMTLTAGRIWWIRQQARTVCGRENIFERRYGVALTLILESGALYCLCAILMAIFQSPNASLAAVSVPAFLTARTYV